MRFSQWNSSGKHYESKKRKHAKDVQQLLSWLKAQADQNGAVDVRNEEIAAACHISETTVKHYLRELATAGAIESRFPLPNHRVLRVLQK